MGSVITYFAKRRVNGRHDEEELCAESCADDGIFRVFISSTCRDGERRRVPLIIVNVVSIFTFYGKLRLIHLLPVYGFDDLVLG